MISVAEIADRINSCAGELAAELLPNGRRAGTRWMFSGIADTGRSESAWVHLSGAKIGKWCDMGNAMAGEDKGDMLDLLRLKLGLADPAAAICEAKRRLGIQDDFRPGVRREISPEERERRAAEVRARAAAREAEDAAEREQKAKRARALFLSAAPIGRTPASLYLQRRGIACPNGAEWPGALRFHAEVWCKPERCKVPAMLSAIYRADGVQIGTHRTYLQLCPKRGWIKIDGLNAKMVLGNMWGGFIPINKGASGKSMRHMPEGEPVYVTEGIEDALVVRLMKPEARIIAAISLPNVGAILLPPTAKRLVFVADRDTNDRALEQQERSIAQQQARGMDVSLVMPPVPHKDVNDWWLAIQNERAA